MKLPPLNLPAADLRLREDGGILRVYDPLRRRYVALTPEEYVRQHFAAWLQTELHYPASLLANEVAIDLNGTRKRCDTVAYDLAGRPLMIVEYKAPDVTVTQEVFDQIVRYNMTLRARYLTVSNGMNHYCCVMDYAAGSYHFIPRVPDFRSITNPHGEN